MKKSIKKSVLALLSLFFYFSVSAQTGGPGGVGCPASDPGCQDCWEIDFELTTPNSFCGTLEWFYPGTPNCGNVIVVPNLTGPSTTNPGFYTHSIKAPCKKCLDGPCQCPSNLFWYDPNGGLVLDIINYLQTLSVPTTVTSTVTCGGVTYTMEATVTAPFKATIKLF